MNTIFLLYQTDHFHSEDSRQLKFIGSTLNRCLQAARELGCEQTQLDMLSTLRCTRYSQTNIEFLIDEYIINEYV